MQKQQQQQAGHMAAAAPVVAAAPAPNTQVSEAAARGQTPGGGEAFPPRHLRFHGQFARERDSFTPAVVIPPRADCGFLKRGERRVSRTPPLPLPPPLTSLCLASRLGALVQDAGPGQRPVRRVGARHHGPAAVLQRQRGARAGGGRQRRAAGCR